MNLHLDKNNFEGAIVAAAEHFGIPEIFIEKDYWVTYALHQLFHSDVKDLVVFKGGTSLSKCYNVIQRFSEDIDMVIEKNSTDAGNDLKRKLKDVTTIIDNLFYYAINCSLQLPTYTFKLFYKCSNFLKNTLFFG